jgi:hypothetical protein
VLVFVGFGLFHICAQLPFSPHSKDHVLHRFDADAFNNINKLPTLDRDPPQNSIVAIGYTCNTFPYAMQLSAPRNETGISFNLQFVILLGQLPE